MVNLERMKSPKKYICFKAGAVVGGRLIPTVFQQAAASTVEADLDDNPTGAGRHDKTNSGAPVLH